MWDGEHHRGQVERALRRALTDEELVVVADLSSLPSSHLDVVEKLYRRDAIEATYYLLGVTTDVDQSEARNYVHDFDRLVAQRYKRHGLRAQQLYESDLGRPLTADEIVEPGRLEAVNSAQREVARAIAAKDRAMALHYLSELAPTSTPAERQAFLETLRLPS